MAKKRPVRRAFTAEQIQGEIARYDRLTTDGLKKIEQVAKRVGGYQRKLQYYRKRAEELAARELQRANAAAEEVGRSNLRSVQV